MGITTKSAVFAALAASALAAPMTQKRSNGGAFTVPRHRKPNYVRDLNAELRRVHAKYGSTRFAEDDGSVPAVPASGGAEYVCKVDIGGQTLNLDFDTGSSDLWVFSTELPSDQQNGQTLFDPSQSSTFQELQGYTWDITYADQSSSSGNVGTDTVNVGGATVTGQAVELATQVSAQFAQNPDSDGLLGLAFSQINTVSPQKQKTFFDNVAGSLSSPVLAADLRTDDSGSYTFGQIDSSVGDIAYAAVDTSNGVWQFDSSSFSIGGQQQDNSDGTPAIADTGTTLCLVDDAVLEALYGQIDGAQQGSDGSYVYPCDADVPDFGVAIGDTGYYAVIPGQNLAFQQQGNQCLGGVQSNQGIGLQIYGDAVLREQYVVFDLGNTQVGFAPKP